MAEIKHKGARIAGVIVTLITLTAWLPALQNGFVNWDDNTYVYENPHIKSLDFKFLKWAFSSFYFNNYHPITMLSYALDHSIWGLNPFGYHFTNVIFHAANTFLVFVLAVRLMECGMREKTEDKKNLSITQPLKLSTSQPLDQKTPNFHLIAAAVTALLFGLHPIHVESVAWVSERKDVLCAFFFLLSLLAYVRYVSSEGFKKVRSYAVCLFFFTLALMSKPMAVTLPLVLLILDYCPFNRLTLKGILEKIPFFLLSFVFSLLTIWAQQSDGALKTMETFPLINRILIAIHGYLFYLFKIIFPVNLSPFYPYPRTISVFAIEFVGPIIIILTLSFIAIGSLRKTRIFPAVWIYYLLTLLPVIGIFQIGAQSAADRYAYIPSIGPFLLLGIGLSTVLERYSRVGRTALITALSILAFIIAAKTVEQTTVWRDSIQLWSYVIKLSPDGSDIPYTNRGIAFYRLNEYEKAVEDFNTATKLNFNEFKAFYNRGNTYLKMGNLPQAIKDFGMAVEISPGDARAYTNRGIAHLYSGNHEQAQDDFNAAIRLAPEKADFIYYSRALVYNSLGKDREAIDDFIRAANIGSREAQGYLDKQGIAWRHE